MAGDWIKFEHATLDKPEVLVLADYLETTPDDVIGKLLRVWVWFDKNSVDGDASGVTSVTLMKFLDRLVDRQGFASCLKKVGWLTESGMPNFERHNGESAKKRALTSKRTKKWRDAPVTPVASPEKRREEKKETRKASAFVPPDWVPVDAWNGWIEVRRKNRWPITDRALALAVGELEALRGKGHDPSRVIDLATLKGWRSFYPPKDALPKVDDPFRGVEGYAR